MTTQNKTHPDNQGEKTFAFGGGILGLIVFLIVGLLPSLVYGGFAGAALAAGLLGHPVDASLMARGITIFGMVAGLLSTAGVFVVVGAVLGSTIHALARATMKTEVPEAKDETATENAK
ncbi:MAG: hypothetical protein P1V51_13735 [Deltaproteobacteria bacterium]|nr:hypothetical protein [Deltaproteobacteria bacterium]